MAKSEDIVSLAALSVKQKKHSLILTKMRADDLVRISYVAARGDSQEKNAVQRILSRPRISGISEFAKNGGDFPVSIVLNWVNKEHKLTLSNSKLKLTLEPRSAQLLDGQHRVEGLREAMKTDTAIKSIELPIAIYQNLSAQDCADIFLSINTEQKPVSRNLVYDLYGLASDYVRDDDALAARKVADELNERDDSPYKDMIRYPGPGKVKTGIALSSIAGVLKPLLAVNGAFDQVGVSGDMREERVEIILNWLKVIRHAYGTQWTDKGNVFRYASGFWGAMEFLSTTMLRHCYISQSYEQTTMQSAMKGLKDRLIWQSDVSGMQGRRSANLISGLLGNVFSINNKSKAKIKV
jgi:DNA sulfur modification protein DndB